MIQKFASPADYFQQASAGMMVFGMAFEMFGQLIQAVGQYGNLNLCRPGVVFMQFVVVDNRCFFVPW